MNELPSPPLPRHIAAALRSLIPVVCPHGGSGLDDDVLTHTTAILNAAPRHIRLALYAGIVAYDLGAIAHPGVAPKPAHRLSLTDRQRYFGSWWNSPLMVQRELAKALKGFLALSYYEQPQARESVGYTPAAWIEHVKRRRLATYSEAVAAHQRALVAPDPLPTGTFDRNRTSDALRGEGVSHAS